MAALPDTVSMAMFCDFENVALGVREALAKGPVSNGPRRNHGAAGKRGGLAPTRLQWQGLWAGRPLPHPEGHMTLLQVRGRRGWCGSLRHGGCWVSFDAVGVDALGIPYI